MSESVISVRGIGKKYRLGFTHSHDTLRDKIADGVRRIAGGRKLHNNQAIQLNNNPQKSKEFWALKNVSFDVQEGEMLGIIGANGAGKSTLLKILSEITEPTEGEIRIRGRVASLLEVGTGFHPELSGRENVYMNGAILGMTKGEIKAKFDEIVEFSGVEKFIDTPIKRYSSGMQVRLAFAVAAHLEPEIFLVDEVLAVGDVEFQNKCMAKMQDVSTGGRTVLFVSHNVQAIRQLTSRCILLEKGIIAFDGDKFECISNNLQANFDYSAGTKEFPNRKPTVENPVCIKSVSLRDEDGISKSAFSIGESWSLEMELESIEKNIKLYATVHIKNEYGTYVYHLVSMDTGQNFLYSDFYLKLRATLPKLSLYPGKYSVDVWASRADSSWKNLDNIIAAISFDVHQFGRLQLPRKLNKGDAVAYEVSTWEIEDKKGNKSFMGGNQ